ncbi:MAG: DNA (cytosine-5-)-methyltransferase [Bacteroidota bacterium]
MNHGSLFSGIGGFDLAAEWMGWNNVFHCEINPFGQKILKQHFPNSIPYADITKTNFTIHRGTIDILTGGFPCQPYSVAGKRKGKEDERHLWPEMLRTIREIYPTYVVGENVPGIISWDGGLVFNEVQTDLENEGYEVLPFLLPACSKNAPHKRERVWFVAYASGKRCNDRSDNRQERHVQTNFGASEKNQSEWDGRIGRISEIGSIDTNTNNKGLQRCEKQGGIKKSGKKPNKQSTGLFCADWEKFPTQSPICRGNDGISDRVDRIKALGNAIVPQVAYQIFKSIAEYENLYNENPYNQK